MSDAFHRFEHAQWQAAVEPYHLAWGGLTRQTIPALLDAMAVAPGTRVLDVACGPGYLTAEAAARGATATGVDFAGGMVARARTLYPGLEFREGDATALPFPDASFDAVGMNFGMLHLARPEAAMAEAFRVLRPGGRYAFTVWAPPDRAPSFALVLQAIREHGRAVELPPGPDFFLYSDAERSAAALDRAGFEEPRSLPVDMRWRLGEPADLFRAFHDGTARTGALLRGQPGSARGEVERAVRDAGARYEVAGGGLEIPMAAVLTTATRPGG